VRSYKVDEQQEEGDEERAKGVEHNATDEVSGRELAIQRKEV